MYRIDTGRAVLTRPTEDPPASPGYFTGGDPNTGNLPTQLSAAWCNAIQESIARVIEAFGGTMTKGSAGDIDLVEAIKNGFRQYSGYAEGTHGLMPVQNGTYQLTLPFTAPFPGRIHARTWQNSASQQPFQASPPWSVALYLSFNGGVVASENTQLPSFLSGSMLLAAGTTVEVEGTVVTAAPGTAYMQLSHYLEYNFVPWAA